MIDVETLALLCQLELEALAELIRHLQEQLLTDHWLEWTIEWAGKGYRHITDLSWLPRWPWVA